jgi:hypothetical protein
MNLGGIAEPRTFMGGRMRVAPVVVLRASSTVRQGIQQLADVPDDMDVVVVRDRDGDVIYYVLAIRLLHRGLSQADPDADLASALKLDDSEPAIALPLDLGVVGVALDGSVALQGRHVAGVVFDDDIEPQYTDIRTRADSQRAWVRGVSDPRLASDIDVDLDGLEFDAVDGGGPGVGTDGPPADHAARPTTNLPTPPETDPSPSPPHTDLSPPPRLFRAYPDVKAPGQVGADQVFTIDVGFSRRPAPAMLIAGPPVNVLSGPKAEFTIQVAGFGFTFPEGIERTLTVDRDNPESGRAEFAVRADPAESAAARILEASYAFSGVVVGRTWTQIQVIPDVPAQPVPIAQAHATGLVSEITDKTAPHLSVDIYSQEGGSELRWRFHTRYPEIQRPLGEVTTILGDHSARSFALQLMRQLPNLTTEPWLSATMKGAGRQVADLLPREFWKIFAQAWQRARADGDQPRMQIIITEPWIPWELAWIQAERFDEAAELLAPDFPEGATLGQLWQVARWTTPIRRLTTGDVPASPPASMVDANEMAVIIGNYANLSAVPALPHAAEEGSKIANAYGALSLSASDEEVGALMGCVLRRDGKDFEPTVIHFAGHGQTDVNNPQFTGLVLEDGRRLDPLAITGFRLVARQEPFVFLNACEAGVAGETLMNVGGLVGAFLVEGARGFVAPLWKVDDEAARDIAVEFYRRTFERGETVSEAMRQIRSQFRRAAASELAYVFYGNPDLGLKRGMA